jgi:phosphoribosylanthranilate isomerase
MLWTIKGHSKMCSFVTQQNAKMFQVLGERAIGMLTAEMSTRVVARELF